MRTVTPVGVVKIFTSPAVELTHLMSAVCGLVDNVADGVCPGAKFSTRMMSVVMVDTVTLRPCWVVTFTVSATAGTAMTKAADSIGNCTDLRCLNMWERM